MVTLEPQRYRSIRFNKNLYQLNRHQMNDQSQSPLCTNCLIPSNGTMRPINTVKSFRTNIYGRFSMPMFNVKIEDEDVIHVLDKKSRIFQAVNGLVIHAHAVNGVFCVDKDQIEFKGTSFKQIKMVVAFFFE